MTHVLVLTAAQGVTDAQCAAVADAVGSPAVRLDDCAAEFACGPDALDAARAALGDAPADANVVPAANRRKRMLIADMDSTMIPVECIDEIADFAGVRDQVSDITERAMRGELDFEGALRARVALLAGLPESTLAQVHEERISLNPGARTLVRTMNAHGAVTALVSGGFEFFTARVAAEAGFAIHQANRLEIVEGRLSGAVADPILGRQAKLDALRRISAEHGFGPQDAIAVGDGANDLAMVEAAGLGVAFRAKPALEAGADAALRHSDLTALLHLQGYRRDAFAD